MTIKQHGGIFGRSPTFSDVSDSGTSAVRIIKSTNNATSETFVTNTDMLSTDNRNSLIISGCYRTT